MEMEQHLNESILNTSNTRTNSTGYFSDTSMKDATPPAHDWNSETVNETLDELNFRYAQSLLPFAVILGLFCFIGIIGNAIVIMVFTYSKEYRNTNFKVFVLCLAAFDLLSCVTLLPAEIFKTRHFFSISYHSPCKVKCFFNIFAMNASAYILLVICVDRYRKVCQPLKKQFLPSIVLKTLGVALLLSFLFSIPAPIMCGVTEHLKTNLNGNNITVYVCSAEEKYHNNVFRYVYKLSLSVLLVIIAFSLIVMYIMIMRAVINHWGKRLSGETIRFVTTRSPEPSGGKVGVERLTDHEYLIMKLKTIEGDAHVNAYLRVYVGGSGMKKKVNEECNRQGSSGSNSPSSTKGRWSITRSSSDVSLRNRIIRCRSSSSTRHLPYKTLIWFILTLIFLLTFIINAGLSFMSTEEYSLSPTGLFWFQLFFRLYFVNNIVNPIIYILLDKRFKRSLKNIVGAINRKCSRRLLL